MKVSKLYGLLWVEASSTVCFFRKDYIMLLEDLSTSELENELARRKLEREKEKPLPLSESWPNSPIGRWQVTTEGDCEGRTTKQLGTYDGHVADIAFRLGNCGGYQLAFNPDKPLPELPPQLRDKTKTIHISLGIESGTWNFDSKVRSASVGDWLASKPAKDVNFNVSESNYYAGVMLERKDK